MKTFASILLLALSNLSIASQIMTLNVNKNQKIVAVTLPANPTTGYQWTIKTMDHSLLKLESSQYLSSKSGLMGAGGQMIFNFSLIAGKSIPEKTTLVFSYAQPWEPQKGTEQLVELQFH